MSSQPAAIKQNYQRALPKEENKVQENSTKLMKETTECVILEKIKIALSLGIDVDKLLKEAMQNVR